MEGLVGYLRELSRKHTGTLYLNAFNGARFDHTFLWSELHRQGIIPEKFSISNGAIVMLTFSLLGDTPETKIPSGAKISCIDISKHVLGSLKSNLESFKCNIVKGDFDHDLACPWEVMAEDLREQCKKYLYADVLGMKELYEKLNASIYDQYKANLTSYISTSSLTYTMWKKSIAKRKSPGTQSGANGKHYIQLPSIDQEKDFRQAVRGGRTYLSKKRFISEQYNDVIAGKVKYDDIKDYVVDADVVSLYPTAMTYEYPVGGCVKWDPSEPDKKGVMGIYKIKYITNKNCQHSVGGRRELSGKEKGALRWDLKDETEGGWYTSIDIADMVGSGYKVEYLEGWYWEKTEPLFRDYINELFEKKKLAPKGSPSYELAKLFMNSLYGKTIQRPIYTKTIIMKCNADYWKFRRDHNITDVQIMGTSIVLAGEAKEVKEREKCIGKPTHLGAFILAYSRRIMLGFMKQANPHFDSEDEAKRVENDFYYTDTDSLQMHIRNAENMKGFGGKELGCIDDDLKGGKVIRGIWIAPKLYMLEYMKDDNKLHYHFRGKGLSAKNLSVKVFEDMDAGKSFKDVRDFSFKRINIKRNGKQQHIPQFSIVHVDSKCKRDVSKLTRVVNETKWAGRKFDGVNSVPHGAN
jgi:hypothetical protein